MEKVEEAKIHDLVREKLSVGSFSGSGYWDWYRWVKSLNFGHRPTKEETEEVLFFGLSLKQNSEDWRDGARQLKEKALGILKPEVQETLKTLIKI